MERRTKAHAVKFTDEDWERIKKMAAQHDETPTAFINKLVGDHYKRWVGTKWDGLEKQGWPEGKKRKSAP